MAYVFAIAALLASFWQSSGSQHGEHQMSLQSSSFEQGQPIPQKYTCDGDDTSPQLQWSNAPQGTKSFALITDDPDAPAGIWVHWVLFNIPPDKHELTAGTAKTAAPSAGEQGLNDFKKVGYGGPCPPPGPPHRYFFKLYALDTQLPAKQRATKKDVEEAMQGHALATAELMGTYQRKAQ